MTVQFMLNGHSVTYEGEGDVPLLWALREQFGLTGTKYGCGIAQCGACTVHLDGKSRRSCITPVEMVAGRSVTTIEGASDAVSSAVKESWRDIDVPQCGFCQSGQIMSAIGLLAARPDPTDAEIDKAMAGNICRCATYNRIRKAIQAAGRSLKNA